LNVSHDATVAGVLKTARTELETLGLEKRQAGDSSESNFVSAAALLFVRFSAPEDGGRTREFLGRS
jgi:hypothetical protein